MSYAATFTTLVATARLLPRVEVAAYQQVWLVFALLEPLLLAGVPSALLYFLPRQRTDTELKRFLTSSYLMLACLGLVFAMTFVILANPVAQVMDNPDLEVALRLFAPYAFVRTIAAGTPPALVAVGRSSIAAILHASSSAFAGVLVVSVLLIHREVNAMIIAYTCSAAISAVIGVAIVTRLVGVTSVSPSDAVDRIRRILAYSLPLALTGVAGVLGYQFDRLLVSARFPPDQYALYAIGSIEIPLALTVQTSINNVLMPALSRRYADNDVQGMIALWQEGIRKTGLVVLPMFGFLIVFAGDLILAIFGPRYEESADIFRIYLLLLPLRVATYGLITAAIGRTRVNLSAGLVVLFAAPILAILLIWPLGMEGAAVGFVGATFLVAIYYLIRLRGILNVPIRRLFPWRVTGVNLAFALAATIPLLPLLWLEMPSGLRFGIAGILYTVVYGATIVLTGRLTSADQRRLRRSIGALVRRERMAG